MDNTEQTRSSRQFYYLSSQK